MKFFWEVFVTLFVIIDPPGTVPVFLGLTRGSRTPPSPSPTVLYSLGLIAPAPVVGRVGGPATQEGIGR
jgi:multiple antibiotic resistance protein